MVGAVTLKHFFLINAALLTAVTAAPNIIFIVVDDLGFSDVGYRNSDILSPSIDKLASEGVILNASYVQSTCSPSRTAMLTGRYPYKLGMQNQISEDHKQCLPLNEILLPERLKLSNYKTHAIGKWHLGFCNWACVPTRRGFDTFYGIYGGGADKYTHRSRGEDKSMVGFDFRENETPLRSVRNKYSADLYGQRAVNLINAHDTSNPMFMWLSFQNVHSPVQVPSAYSDKYSQFSNQQATYYGMVTILDEYVGRIVNSLKAKKMYDNSLIILTTDNGGKVSNGGSNWPLRGEKGTVYEGGTRGVTFINSPLLQNRGYVHDGLFHAIDWTPTLLHFAEGTTPINSIFDGVDQFDMLTTGSPSKRTSFLYEINRGAAIRDGDYKLIVGFSGNFDGYSAQPGATSASVTSAVRKKRMAGRAFSRRLRRRRQMGASNRGPGRRTPGSGARNQGGRNLGGRNQGNQRQRNSKQLFNLKDDPSETRDLSAMFPDVVLNLEKMIDSERQNVVEQIRPTSLTANPSNFNGFWSPGWC